MRAVDFFCGAGGFTVGLRKSGVHVLAGVDANEGCRQTYEHNNPQSSFICADIKRLRGGALRQAIPLVTPDDDEMVFVGCAPCQPFSQQRRSSSPHPDGTLLGHFAALVKEYRPGFVVVENVPGIARVKGRSTFVRFVKMLVDEGYSVDHEVLDAKDFGVPQSRRRLVLIASRTCVAAVPSPTHGPGRQAWRTVRDAIAEYPAIPAGGSSSDYHNHRASALSELNLRRVKATPTDGGSRTSWPDELILDCHRNDHRGHTDVYGRMSWSSPAPTLTGKCHSLSNGRFGHPVQNRALSLREAAALQSFPDDYEFFGAVNAIALQIGNAVPVALAAALGRQLQLMAEGGTYGDSQ